MLLMILMVKNIIGTFSEKEVQKIDQQESGIEKVIKTKGDKLYVKWKGYDNSFNSWIDKKDLLKMSQYFPKPYELFGGDINVKVDLSNYATKTDLKNVSNVDVSNFALKSNLASLKTEVYKLDIDKLVPIPVDLSKLSDVVKNDVVKKTEYNKLVSKLNSIYTTNFVKKNKYQKDGSDFEDKISKIHKKIPDVNGCVKKADINSKISEVEGKIPSISDLTTNSELIAVENKIRDVNSLVKKTKFNTKITEIEGKIPDVSSLATNSALTAVENKIPDVTSLITKTRF